MTEDIEQQLAALRMWMDSALDEIHAEFLRNMDWLARSTGQRMRTDKPKNNS